MTLSTVSGPLDRSSQMPLYQQLRRSLRDVIEQEVLSPDDVLPAERDIATDFGVSRITVRKAIEGLVEEGLLDRRHGAGTFVASRIQKNMATLSSFSEDMASRDWRARIEWLGKELDYNNLAGLKLALATELAVRASEKAVIKVSGAELSHSMQLGETLCEVIRTNAELVKESEIEEIARKIIGARQVILHGVAASYVPADFLAYKLTRLGVVNYLSTDSHMTSMAVNASGPEDLLLLFSSSGSVRESIELAELARRTSLATIAFTNRFKSPLGDLCDRQVVCVGSESPLSSGSLESKCGHLLIVELLFDAICSISEVHARRIRDTADAVADMQF